MQAQNEAGDLLRILVLGIPEVRSANQLLTFPTRKALALLLYMAVEGGMHSREKLTALLWPDSDTQHARSVLRSTLSSLRTVLRHGTRSTKQDISSPYLVVERDALGFDFNSPHELDLHTLHQAWKLTHAWARSTPMDNLARHTALEQLQQALTLYRSDFLEGFYLPDAPDFDEWVSQQRPIWHQRISVICDQLSALQFEGGEIAPAITTITRWLTLDPLREDAYRRLMQLQLMHEGREPALRTYARCRRRLQQELETEPSPETRELAARIRRSSHVRKTAPVLSVSNPPLVGRATEHAQMVLAYQAASQGQAGIVLLEGEAGIGKTRLATEFLAWAANQGADILRGRASETGGRLPYQPLVEALRNRLETENAPDDLLADSWLIELSRLLPELRERYPDLPVSSGDEETARIRLFEAITRLLQAFASKAPLVLFIDDIQWADTASLDVLHYIGRRCREQKIPLLLLLTLREEHPSLPASWIVDITRDLSLTRLPLHTLSLDETIQLVQAFTTHGELAIERFGRWLFAETQGQPFFLVETLRMLLSQNVIALSLQEDGSTRIEITGIAGEEARLHGLLAPGVRDIISKRVQQLSASAQGLLMAGAVLGQDFSFEHLCRIADKSESEGLLALDELLQAGLLRSGEEMARRFIRKIYSFPHEKIRDVVYAEARETQKYIFHRRAFDFLREAMVAPAQIVHHALKAGLVEPAFHFSIAAGDAAMRLFAIRDALAHYEQATAIQQEYQRSQQDTTFPLNDVFHLATQLGRVYDLAHQSEKAQAVYQSLLTLAKEQHQPAMQCTALNRLATLAMHNFRNLDQARELLQQALEVAHQSADQAGLAETEWNLGLMYVYAFDAPSSLLHGERALALARACNLQAIIASSLNLLSQAKMIYGAWEEVAEHGEEALALYTAMGNRAMQADCLSMIAHAKTQLGLPHKGMQIARTALAISREIENTWGQVYSLVALIPALLDTDQYTEAWDLAQESILLARTLNLPQLLLLAMTMSGTTQAMMGKAEEAQGIHLEVLEFSKWINAAPYIEMTHALLCVDYALCDNWPEACKHALQGCAARKHPTTYVRAFTFPYEIEALLRCGEITQAEEELQRFGAALGTNQRYHATYIEAQEIMARLQKHDTFSHLKA